MVCLNSFSKNIGLLLSMMLLRMFCQFYILVTCCIKWTLPILYYFQKLMSQSLWLTIVPSVWGMLYLGFSQRLLLTANRLKHILPIVISDIQSAFIPNRLIIDNTTIAYELLHKMRNRRKGKVDQMAVKLDIKKAYDWVEWGFLEAIMLKLGFDWRWVHLVRETVSTSSYFVLINDEPKGFITLTCGISRVIPYLHIYFSSMLRVCLQCWEKLRVLATLK